MDEPRGLRYWLPIVVGVAGILLAVVLTVGFCASPDNPDATARCSGSVTGALCTQCCLAHGASSVVWNGTSCRCKGS